MANIDWSVYVPPKNKYSSPYPKTIKRNIPTVVCDTSLFKHIFYDKEFPHKRHDFKDTMYFTYTLREWAVHFDRQTAIYE